MFRFLIPLITPASTSTPTSRDSFEWDGTKIVKFIGDETEVVIPEGTTVIGGFAFLDSILTSVVIPEGVTVIEGCAFWDCRSLTSVVIPDSVEEIGDRVFMGCTALKEWSISSAHPYYKTDGVGLLTKDGKKLLACLASVKEYRVPDGVTEIGNWIFSDYSSLTSVILPESLTVIGIMAFNGCESLTSVVIPEGVTVIGSSAFSFCNLTSVIIPDSVKEIGDGAFGGTPLLEWSVSSAHPYFKSDGVGLLTKDGKKLVACLASAKEYRIPEGVTEIQGNAFECCESLTSVTIPKSMKVIGDWAFQFYRYHWWS